MSKDLELAGEPVETVESSAKGAEPEVSRAIFDRAQHIGIRKLVGTTPGAVVQRDMTSPRVDAVECALTSNPDFAVAILKGRDYKIVSQAIGVAGFVLVIPKRLRLYPEAIEDTSVCLHPH